MAMVQSASLTEYVPKYVMVPWAVALFSSAVACAICVKFSIAYLDRAPNNPGNRCDVRSWGWTGSRRQGAKMTRLDPKRTLNGCMARSYRAHLSSVVTSPERLLGS